MSETSAIRAASSEDDLEPEDSGRATAIDRLMGTIRAEGNSVDGRAAADRLQMALQTLAVNAPTPQTRDLLQGVLDSKALDPFFNSAGESCRAAVISAQLALGFPFALEVSPDDLVFLREVANKAEVRDQHNGTRWAAALSLLWNAGWSGVILRLGYHNELMLFAAPFLIGAGHAATALTTALKTKRSFSQRLKDKKVFRVLAWMGLLGPALSAVAVAGVGPIGLLVGMLMAMPAMITAVACLAASRQPSDGKEQPKAL